MSDLTQNQSGKDDAVASPDPVSLQEVLAEALSVCSSVSMSRDRRVVRDGSVLFLQTEEWCRWLEHEVGPRLQQVIAQLEAVKPVTPGQGLKPRTVAVADDEVLVALKRGDDYDDVHPELVAADALDGRWPAWRPVLDDDPWLTISGGGSAP